MDTAGLEVDVPQIQAKTIGTSEIQTLAELPQATVRSKPSAPSSSARLITTASSTASFFVPTVNVPTTAVDIGTGTSLGMGFGSAGFGSGMGGDVSFFGQSTKANRVVFVIDCSQSMRASGSNKLMIKELAKTLGLLKSGTGLRHHFLLRSGLADWRQGFGSQGRTQRGARGHLAGWPQDVLEPEGGDAFHMESEGRRLPDMKWHKAGSSGVEEHIRGIKAVPTIGGTDLRHPFEMAFKALPKADTIFFLTDAQKHSQARQRVKEYRGGGQQGHQENPRQLHRHDGYPRPCPTSRLWPRTPAACCRSSSPTASSRKSSRRRSRRPLAPPPGHRHHGGVKPVSRSLLVRAIAYGIALLYLTLNLYVFNGPLHRQLGKVARPPAASGHGPASTAARVFGRDISLRAVDQQIILDAARGGRAPDLAATDPATLFDLRLAALDTLIAAICLDAKLTVRQDLFDPAATDAALRDAGSLAGGPAALDARLAVAGLDRPALRDHLRAELARGRYLEERIAASGATTVTDEEIAGWLAAHPKLPDLPAKVKLRHIFKASLRQDPAALLAGMTTVHAGLVAGTLDFATAALQSDDTSNNTNGGELGWVELLPTACPPASRPTSWRPPRSACPCHR